MKWINYLGIFIALSGVAVAGATPDFTPREKERYMRERERKEQEKSQLSEERSSSENEPEDKLGTF